jgi:Adenylate and Guanylate cyclase catalytic domain/FG-GAP-like repeat
VTATPGGDFNGDSRSDILWQNAGGQRSIWDMNANALTGGGAVTLNPGQSWKAMGTGDFNGDGHSDILWQNTSSGQASIWDMNGNALIGGGPVNPNPGLAWKAVGTGDFNGDGESDILFQNTSTGQVSMWEMGGNKLIGGGPVNPNPGLAWKAVGTGDFNGDGESDGLMALFGYPQAQENDAERAVRAALAIQRALVEINARNAAKGAPELFARIGIESGPVVVEAAGEVFGDAPNVAARVQAEAEPGSVLITLNVHRQVAGLFVVEEQGTRELKGASQPVQVFRIARASGGRRRTGARTLTPFVGREEELVLLARRWERAQGRGPARAGRR